MSPSIDQDLTVKTMGYQITKSHQSYYYYKENLDINTHESRYVFSLPIKRQLALMQVVFEEQRFFYRAQMNRP